MGRRLEVIYRQTRINMKAQTTMCPSPLVPAKRYKNPSPKKRPMAQKTKFRKAKKNMESVDCEKTQEIGAKPKSNTPVRAIIPKRTIAMDWSLTSIPPRAEKI